MKELKTKPKPKMYEYKQVFIPQYCDADIHMAELNSLGKEGWELVCVNKHDKYYFKREIR